MTEEFGTFALPMSEQDFNKFMRLNDVYTKALGDLSQIERAMSGVIRGLDKTLSEVKVTDPAILKQVIYLERTRAAVITAFAALNQAKTI